MITVGIASIPERESCLKKTLDSIRGQVDTVFVVLNGYEHAPLYLDYMDNVIHEFGDNSKGDAMKFRIAQYCKGYYIAIDDDLEASRGFVQYLVNGVDKYNGIASLHGKVYLPPVRSYKQWAGNYRCLDRVSGDIKVNLIGSGCCAFRTDRLNVQLIDFKQKNMSDVWLSKIATEQGVPMMVLRHEKGEYLNYLCPPGKTIWQNTQDYSRHVKIMNTFIK
jgi:hypothetical protein